MIQILELRLLNYVLDGNGEIGQVTTLHVGGSVRINTDTAWGIEKITPIPLSASLLEKCGFTPWNAFDGGYISIGNGKYLMMRLYREEWLAFICDINVKKHLYSNPQKIFKSIPKHLHQLQNLYYSIYGTELNITL